MDLKTIKASLEELAEERGISKEKIIETIEMALSAAYKRDYGKRGQIIHASFDLDTGAISFRQVKIVLDPSLVKAEGEIKKVRFNRERHIMIDEAHKIKKSIEPGEEL